MKVGFSSTRARGFFFEPLHAIIAMTLCVLRPTLWSLFALQCLHTSMPPCLHVHSRSSSRPQQQQQQLELQSVGAPGEDRLCVRKPRGPGLDFIGETQAISGEGD
jgi:hypothetical protein